ncbi:hypothetical protein MKEN_00043800 [Mycena kentingensis (nom. inval.)]|nr:hypothetical protein MKEN_00043800 [Mycena kentingensis (nom. inval.)]
MRRAIIISVDKSSLLESEFPLQLATAFSLPRSLRQSSPFPRGLDEIPTVCADECAPFSLFLHGDACRVTECCSSAFEEGYFGCFMCVGTAQNATDFSFAQKYVNVVITACASEGFTLPVLSLPGQDPNRTLSTELPPDASAQPVFVSGSGSASISSPAPTSSAPPAQSSPPAGAASAIQPHTIALVLLTAGISFLL